MGILARTTTIMQEIVALEEHKQAIVDQAHQRVPSLDREAALAAAYLLGRHQIDGVTWRIWRT